MKKDNEKNRRSTNEELTRSGDRQNASSNQGGTTDLDRDALIAGRGNRTERGSELHTKRGVSGSDYDGQAA